MANEMSNVMTLVKAALLVALLILMWWRPTFELSSDLRALQHAHMGLPSHVAAQIGTAVDDVKRGVDLSHYQGLVNFQQVAAAGLDFVYLKATQGTDYTDPTYAQHASAVAKTALLHGAYHYFQPDQDPVAQARHFVQQVRMSRHSMPPMLDVETVGQASADTIRKGVLIWLQHVHQALNCRPILYSYGDFWQQNLGPALNAYPFWLADYSKSLQVPTGLQNLRLWQYSATGRVPGIENQVDLDVLTSKEIHCHD